ncbi:RNA 2',3'-cyclic phosphodiesterase [Halorubrum laminariae]|uniref:RNA 2',3'-cyclic phosphodiesterase n=1 Tax=Halorubrum laminariae TaxID=1433523 RepID=A0ABD6C1P6_9EURY|nr:RNA 2',3'-cyclic phosphodiesterase [Halorubrum laminariae]
MRAFFAVDLPNALADPLAAIQADLDDAAGLRFTDTTQAHVTLKFLGEIGESGSESDGTRPALDDVIAAGERAVADADRDPFKCELTGFGVFPDLEYISVVWAGISDGTAALTALHEALERETTALGVDPAEHAFTPHVTLARMDDARGKDLVQRIVRERDPEFGRFGVDEVELVRSTLTPDGPEYETVETFPLGSV